MARMSGTPRERLEEYKHLLRIAPETFPSMRHLVHILGDLKLDERQKGKQLEEWEARRWAKRARGWEIERKRRAEARKIPSALRREVLNSGPCAYCGDEDVTHVDHILPVSRGGDKRRSNLAPACKRCNEEKLDFTPREWREWRVARGDQWPPEPRINEIFRLIAEMTAKAAAEGIEPINPYEMRPDDEAA